MQNTVAQSMQISKYVAKSTITMMCVCFPRPNSYIMHIYEQRALWDGSHAPILCLHREPYQISNGGVVCRIMVFAVTFRWLRRKKQAGAIWASAPPCKYTSIHPCSVCALERRTALSLLGLGDTRSGVHHPVRIKTTF